MIGKRKLTAEQTQKLLELGVKPEMATITPEGEYIFTLEDILNIVPPEINEGAAGLEIKSIFHGKWLVCYDRAFMRSIIRDELIDALYELILFLNK